MKNYYLLFIMIICNFSTIFGDQSKIVGLIAARNEEHIIQQCLQALSLYTDAIVFLDDASTDNTLAIVQSVATRYHIETILCNTQWFRDEPGDRNKLLQAGRTIGGTHFIVIDADELFTANFLPNNKLKKHILSLKEGDKLVVPWIQLWRSHTQYRDDKSVWASSQKVVAFCDDKSCFYQSEFIHTAPAPYNLKGEIILFTDRSYGLLHFQFVNWENLLLKQAWYACLERIRFPKKLCCEINQRYAPAIDETNINLVKADLDWLNGYVFFDESVYQKPSSWRKNQVCEWFNEYGKDYFAELNIWHIDWNRY